MRTLESDREKFGSPLGPKVEKTKVEKQKGFQPIPGRPGWFVDENGKMARDPSVDKTSSK